MKPTHAPAADRRSLVVCRTNAGRRHGVWAALSCLALGAGTLFSGGGCQQASPAQSPVKAAGAKAKSTPVTLTTARLNPWPLVVQVQGSLLGDERAVVGAKVAGRVREVLVDLGTPVRQGQILCRLEPEEFDLRVQQSEAQLTQARAALGLDPTEPDEKLDRLKSPPVRQELALMEEAKFNLERAQKLFKQNNGFVTAEELQQREAALRVAEARYAASLNSVDEKIALLSVRRAELAQARRLQADSVTVAPFDGVVQERHVAPGVYLNVGHSIVTLVRTDPLRFRAGVPERQATQIQVGQQVTMTVEGQPQPLVAQVTRISPSLDMSSRSLIIEADLPNSDGKLRTGLFAEAEIVVDPDSKVFSVPASAVSEFAGVSKVWVVEGNTAKEHQIVTGRRARDLVEVLEGLSEGTSIISQAELGRAGEVAIAPQASSSAELQVGGE